MLKKILITLTIVTMISTLSIYATDVQGSDVSKNTVQTEDNEEEPKDEGSSSNNTNENKNTDTKDEENQNNNTTNTNTNTSSNKGTSNKTNTANKVKTKPKNEPVTTTVKKSNDADLKTLKIDKEGLSPDFSKEIKEYYLTVDLSVEQIKITAEPVSDKAKVTITGNKNLKEGQNTVTITVKAEDGTSKKYTINVTKVDDLEKANAELKSLEVENYDFYPKFKANIYNYNLNIGDNIQTLEIKAEPEKQNAKVEIEGNTNLQQGDNVIKIKVTAEDGETVRNYKMNTHISAEKVEIKQESKMPAIILLIIVGSGIVVLGAFLIRKKIH